MLYFFTDHINVRTNQIFRESFVDNRKIVKSLKKSKRIFVIEKLMVASHRSPTDTHRMTGPKYSRTGKVLKGKALKKVLTTPLKRQFFSNENES